MLRACLLLLLLPLPSAASPRDNYYSTDIFTAVEEARQRTHHYDYSHALRYNRSTSQSIPIPRLLNQEMAETLIETPGQSAGRKATDPVRYSTGYGTAVETEQQEAEQPLPSFTPPAAASVRVTVR